MLDFEPSLNDSGAPLILYPAMSRFVETSLGTQNRPTAHLRALRPISLHIIPLDSTSRMDFGEQTEVWTQPEAFLTQTRGNGARWPQGTRSKGHIDI